MMMALLIYILLILLYTTEANTSEKSLIRHPSKNPVFGGFSLSNQKVSSNNKTSRTKYGNSNHLPSTQLKRRPNINYLDIVKNLCVNVRDEATDCFDAIVFAESNTERLDNLFEIAYRHRTILTTGGLFLVGKVAFTKSRSLAAAERMKQQMHLAEISKWGNRN